MIFLAFSLPSSTLANISSDDITSYASGIEFATDSRKSDTALLIPLVLLEHPVTTGLVEPSFL